jgi:hypothetical protein
MTPGRWLALPALLLAGACAQQARVNEPAPRPAPAPPSIPTVPPAVEPAAAQPGATQYRCDTGEVLQVHDEGDFVRVAGLPRGEELLGRDAGGLTPQQAVFSGPTLRMEFGLGADGRELMLQSTDPPGLLHCRRD